MNFPFDDYDFFFYFLIYNHSFLIIQPIFSALPLLRSPVLSFEPSHPQSSSWRPFCYRTAFIHGCPSRLWFVHCDHNQFTFEASRALSVTYSCQYLNFLFSEIGSYGLHFLYPQHTELLISSAICLFSKSTIYSPLSSNAPFRLFLTVYSAIVVFAYFHVIELSLSPSVRFGQWLPILV